MTILDRYLLKYYISALLFTLGAFAAVFIIVDLIEDLDKFIDKQVPVRIIMLFYVYYIPEITKLVLPIAVLMAALFTVGRLSRNLELTAVKASGISLYRFFAPVFLFVTALSIVSFYFNESLVILTNRERWEIDRIYLRRLPPSHFSKRNDIYVQDSPFRTVVVSYFDGSKLTGYDVDILSFADSVITGRVLAREIKRAGDSWFLFGGVERRFSSSDEIMERLPDSAGIELNLAPEDLEGIQVRPEEMNFGELGDFIEKLRRLGGESQMWEVERYQKLSFPFSLIIIIIFGMTLASNQWRGGTAAGVGISIFLCFLYYSINISLGPILGQKGVVPPLLAAWLGNMLFGILAVWAIARLKQ